MNIEQARFNMVEQQIRPWDVLDQEVLDLLFEVKREQFVPPTYQSVAFVDAEIPLGRGATMLTPKIEARVMQALHVRKSDKVLEVGTGSGYMAALLAARANHVYSVEIDMELAATARENLKRAGVDNVTVEDGDGARGWPAHAPYDVIVLSGSTPVVPQELLHQLKPGGRMIAFVGEAPVMQAQLTTNTGEGGFQTVNLFETVVAPLKNAPQPQRFVF
jgi:protein-L-isoaspartate(D-aspartate) O-methyltransferase